MGWKFRNPLLTAVIVHRIHKSNDEPTVALTVEPGQSVDWPATVHNYEPRLTGEQQEQLARLADGGKLEDLPVPENGEPPMTPEQQAERQRLEEHVRMEAARGHQQQDATLEELAQRERNETTSAPGFGIDADQQKLADGTDSPTAAPAPVDPPHLPSELQDHSPARPAAE